MNHTFWIALIGALTGVAGTIFGFVNTLHIISVDSIRLKVIPEYTLIPSLNGDVGQGFAIEVKNLSYMPVTIENIEIELSDRKRLAIGFDLMRSDGLPRRMPPRESFTFNIILTNLKKYIENNSKAFSMAKYMVVTTGGGLKFKGTSKAFKDLIKKAKAIENKDFTNW